MKKLKKSKGVSKQNTQWPQKLIDLCEDFKISISNTTINSYSITNKFQINANIFIMATLYSNSQDVAYCVYKLDHDTQRDDHLNTLLVSTITMQDFISNFLCFYHYHNHV